VHGTDWWFVTQVKRQSIVSLPQRGKKIRLDELSRPYISAQIAYEMHLEDLSHMSSLKLMLSGILMYLFRYCRVSHAIPMLRENRQA
jgi:hypothetical protein